MNTSSLFKTILEEIDQKPFLSISEDEIYNRIHKAIPEGYKDFVMEEEAELIAFHYPASYPSEFPYLGKVNSEMMNYWAYRSEVSEHPILVARYSGLVHEYSKKAIGKNPHHTISRKHISALLDIIEQKLYKVPVYAKEKVTRSFKIALSINDASAIERSKKAIISLENDIAVNDKPGLWGFSYDLLLEGTKRILSESEEIDIIETLERRLSEMVEVDTWAAEHAAERLARYYFKGGRIEEVRRVLDVLEVSYEKAMLGVPVIQKVNYIERLYQLKKQFQLHSEAEVLLVKLRNLGEEVDKEMKKISTDLDIPKEKIDQYVEQILLGGDTEQIFYRIVEAHIPSIEQAKADLEHFANVAPFQFMLSKTLQDHKGRKIATIGPIAEDLEGHLIAQISNSIRIGTILLHFVFEEGSKQELISSQEVLKFLKKSCIISSDRLFIFQKGIDAYFNHEYLIAMHLLVPQFEESIRVLLEMNGGNVLVERDGQFNLKTFDHILGDSIIKDVFGEDMTLYFRVLFTEKRGWNLRNRIAHGMLDTVHFNKQNLDRVLHAILCLGMVRLTNDK